MATTEASLLNKCERFFEQGYAKANPPELQKTSLAIYRALAKSQPVNPNNIAGDLGLSRSKLDQILTLLPKNSIDVDAGGNIIGFVGFSLKPANHQFFIGGKEFYTWCVLDALFLPSLLQSSARLVTKCPETDEKIEVNLTAHSVLDASPPAPVVSLVATAAEECCDDLRAVFCNHVNLFHDIGAFEKWNNNKEGQIAVPLKEAFAIALQRNHWRYPDIDWKAKF
ncbi:MAG: organomercurial lyase [Sphingomonadales bacterium]